MSTPPPRCNACQVNRVAWTKPRVDFCYDCLPGGPFPAPPCRNCGSAEYFSQGQCGTCHPGAPMYPFSCRGCLAWGVYRVHNRHCWSCRWWQNHYPVGECLYCHRTTRIGDSGACRLCLEQARRLKEPDRAVDLVGANRFGQQLYLANLHAARSGTRRDWVAHQRRRAQAPLVQFAPVRWRQLLLFRMPPNHAALKSRAAAADSEMVRFCDAILRDHAARHGWSRKQINDTARSLKLLQVLQDTLGAKINASDVLELPGLGGTAASTMEILAAADLLIDDRTTAVHRYFTEHAAGLPPQMRDQLCTWFEVMLGGSKNAPRRLPRHPQTAHLHILGMAPIWHMWADRGVQSLAEISREDVAAALPPSGANRCFAEQGLRGLFDILKARKQVFTNPARGLPATHSGSTIPLPLDTELIRAALNSDDPASALAVALVAFHGMTGPQLQELALTDIRDGRLTIDDRTIPLAGPVRTRLAAYLDHRGRTWPTTINPHLFINRRTGPRTNRVGRGFPWVKLGVKPQALREDRILQEIHATGGDVRRICDLFGLTVAGAMRYTTGLDAPDPTGQPAVDPRSEDRTSPS
ncbi:hypothetical protein [Streptomyces sp. NPDC056949]|uniref:hypothetical protein n=1 Tax=Streptomyces sp. NPDC056949 TaxID=3345976 RepID=UPI003643A302